MSGEKVQVLVQLDAEDVEWAKEHYPKKGFMSYFMRRALSNFRRLHTITPNQVIEEAVQDISLDEFRGEEKK